MPVLDQKEYDEKRWFLTALSLAAVSATSASVIGGLLTNFICRYVTKESVPAGAIDAQWAITSVAACGQFVAGYAQIRLYRQRPPGITDPH